MNKNLCSNPEILLLHFVGIWYNMHNNINNNHTYLFYSISFTLVGSLGRCLNTRPIDPVFKQLPGSTLYMNASKSMCDPFEVLLFPIIAYGGSHFKDWYLI